MRNHWRACVRAFVCVFYLDLGYIVTALVVSHPTCACEGDTTKVAAITTPPFLSARGHSRKPTERYDGVLSAQLDIALDAIEKLRSRHRLRIRRAC